MIPPSVEAALEELRKLPKLQGAEIDAYESEPGIWNIRASVGLCLSCVRPIGRPTGRAHLLKQGDIDAKITLLPHVCFDCLDKVAGGKDDPS
jgi:hypothetical protein